MVSHDNVHIPKESWPNWTWYVLEFFIAFAVSLVIAWKATDSIEGLNPDFQNWVFFAITGIILFLWYIVIRGLILKKKILRSRG